MIFKKIIYVIFIIYTKIEIIYKNFKNREIFNNTYINNSVLNNDGLLARAKLIVYIYIFILFVILCFFTELYDEFGYFQNSIFLDFFTQINTNLYNLYLYYSTNSYGFIFIFLFFYFFNTLVLSISTYLFAVRGVFVISAASIICFWFTQFYFINEFFFDYKVIYTTFDIFNFEIGAIPFSFSLKIDFISYCFLFLTTSIGCCAIVYALGYFKNEPHTDRFILLLNWFILSMSLLVIADSSLLMFLGWELIGLTSFLLINFWTLRRNTLKSAIKAFTFNKVSDVFLLFFIIIMAQQTGSFNITDWYSYFLIVSNFTIANLAMPVIFLILAASIKSAQIIGHLWLPDSMEAPIPASALIHSATLVSAGVYLLLKFNWMLKMNYVLTILLILGSITAFYGAVVSAAQTDCKKLLAYSTVSHCGFLFFTIGLDNVYLTITYLYLHGFFKALTFFCVGNLVKVSRGYQDTRKMGQLFSVLPIDSILLIVCAANLGALPFTVGYFYKSLLLTLIPNNYTLLLVTPFIFIAMLSSVIYVFRLVFYSLFDVQKGNNINFDYHFKNEYNDVDYSNTTALGTIFIFLLLSLATYIYMFYISFMEDFLFFNPSIDVDFIEILQNIKKNNVQYYYLFYSFFCVVCLILVKTTCRYEFSVLKKNFTLYIFVLFLLFIQVNFLIISLFLCI